jgi:hypothetical protein
MGFDGVGVDKFTKVFHESLEENNEKKIALKSFRSLPPIDAEDTEVNLLHMIFDLKGVLVGREYFRINHLLPLLFNSTWGCNLLGKNVVPRLTLKEFLLKYLKQFIVYIWVSTQLAKMSAYLRKH